MNSQNNTKSKIALTLVTAWTTLAMVACNNGTTASQMSGLTGDPGITGGTAVTSGSKESLSTVALYFPTGKTATSIANFCSGTLIAQDLVLTAGHCFGDFAKDEQTTPAELAKHILIGFGLKVAKSTADKAVEFRSVAAYQINPKYVVGSVSQATKKPMYDMTLIKLNEPAPAEYKPAQLVTDASVLKKGLTVTLVGFGLLSAQPEKFATKMMEVDVLVDNPAITATQFTYKVIAGKSSCSGDSGGPAYVDLGSGELGVVGVTSWGDQTCEQLGAYTSVPAMSAWIEQASRTL